MRYLVQARLKEHRALALRDAIADRSLGRGSVAGDEYLRNMAAARQFDDGNVLWVEVCYCPTPLEEETPYWEEYFELEQIKDAHNSEECRDKNSTDPWACSNCDCTRQLEERLSTLGISFRSLLDTHTKE